RRLPPRALGKLQHARAAPGARHPARLRRRREHDQHLAFSPRADLRVAKANALRAPDAQWVAIRPAWLPLLLSCFSAQSLEAMVLRHLRYFVAVGQTPQSTV